MGAARLRRDPHALPRARPPAAADTMRPNLRVRNRASEAKPEARIGPRSTRSTGQPSSSRRGSERRFRGSVAQRRSLDGLFLTDSCGVAVGVPSLAPLLAGSTGAHADTMQVRDPFNAANAAPSVDRLMPHKLSAIRAVVARSPVRALKMAHANRAAIDDYARACWDDQARERHRGPCDCCDNPECDDAAHYHEFLTEVDPDNRAYDGIRLVAEFCRLHPHHGERVHAWVMRRFGVEQRERRPGRIRLARARERRPSSARRTAGTKSGDSSDSDGPSDGPGSPGARSSSTEASPWR
jgi:hypothetical protein